MQPVVTAIRGEWQAPVSHVKEEGFPSSPSPCGRESEGGGNRPHYHMGPV